MKLGIMQPYFFPYIGYWQLLNCVDTFVVYDNIQYTKKGWFNRNRFLQNGKDKLFSIPLKNDSQDKTVIERFIAPEYNREKLILQLRNAYSKAPYYSIHMPVIEEIIRYPSDNLFEYLYNSITEMCKFLEIDTKIVVSSDVDIDHGLKGQDKVIAICQKMTAENYINAIGGQSLYVREDFESEGIDLEFIKPNDIIYKQFTDDFVPNLSIVDVMMFNPKEKIQEMLGEYEKI